MFHSNHFVAELKIHLFLFSFKYSNPITFSGGKSDSQRGQIFVGNISGFTRKKDFVVANWSVAKRLNDASSY